MKAVSSRDAYTLACEKLGLIGQTHLLTFWPLLKPSQQNDLLHQINDLDPEFYSKQLQLLKTPKKDSVPLTPFLEYSYAGSIENKRLGQQLISEGKVACLIVAGGQGSRLKFKGAKGRFPVTPIRHKSLFQIFAEKTVAASKLAGKPLRLAIMTSPQNHEETQSFFFENHFFGLDQKQISFFSQKEIPFLDNEGNMFLSRADAIAKGADGNGACLLHLVRSGIWGSWRKEGVHHLNLILIDNALADPFDAELVGFQAANKSSVSVKCIERLFPDEKVGLLAKNSHGVHVVEYTEMPEKERTALSSDGKLKHRCANISNFCFDHSFVEDITEEDPLAWHIAHKAAPYVDENGNPKISHVPNAWKFERYIFDLLPSAKSVSALLYPREACYAPLKNHSGDNSLQTVQSALIQRDKEILEAITNTTTNLEKMELSQEFYYPSEELIRRWRDRKITNLKYIEDI